METSSETGPLTLRKIYLVYVNNKSEIFLTLSGNQYVTAFPPEGKQNLMIVDSTWKQPKSHQQMGDCQLAIC